MFSLFGGSQVVLQCLYKKTMVIKAHKEVVIDGKGSDKDKTLSLKDTSDDGVEYPIEDEAFMVR
jgi:hypothetical protein